MPSFTLRKDAYRQSRKRLLAPIIFIDAAIIVAYLLYSDLSGGADTTG